MHRNRPKLLTLRLLVVGLAMAAGTLTATFLAAAQPEEEGTGTDNVTHVANLQYAPLLNSTTQGGSDVEFMRLEGRDYALAGTTGRNGMQIVDITDPTQPEIVGVYECPISQGDVQVWTNGDRVLASYTADSTIGAARIDTQCARDHQMDGTEIGTFIVDVSDPTAPTSVSFISIPKGSHNQTIHPSGRYLYNSNSELITSLSAEPIVTIYDVSDPVNPRHVQDYVIPFQPVGLGSESHDISFNADGSRAYVAALSQTLILDTTDPANPAPIAQIIDPAINVHHGADPVTLPREDGSLRTVVIITDEQAGAAANPVCPGGGLHVYDVSPEVEDSPEKMGTWFLDDASPNTSTSAACTSHVMRYYPDQKLMTIAWYARGVRVIDISGLADFSGNDATVAFGDGVGLTEIGYMYFDDSDTWSFKTNRIEADGSFYGYGNDIARGFDVYRFDGDLDVPPLEPVDFRPPTQASPSPSPPPTTSPSPDPTSASPTTTVAQTATTPNPTTPTSPAASPPSQGPLPTTGAGVPLAALSALAAASVALRARRSRRND